MRHRTMVLLLAMMLSALPVAAQVVCWQATPFTDVVRASGVIQTDSDPVTFALASVMEQAGSLYRMASPSVAVPSLTALLTYEFTVYWDNQTTFFGNNPDCRGRFSLNAITLNGSNIIACTGGVSPFTVTVPLTYQPICNVALAIAAERALLGALAAGAPENNEFQP